MLLPRKWLRWLRWSVLLLCVIVTWLYVRSLLLSNVIVQNHNEFDGDSRRLYDHWGPGTQDIDWLPNLLAKRSEEIPVVVVEEHYEVIKYWFQAADLGVIPKSKNILIHIDAHVDGAIPYDVDDIPWFRYPSNGQEIHNMMQSNDMFIVTAALTGLVSHVVWVWPSWDSGNHSSWDHIIVDVEMGYTRVKVDEGMTSHKMDLCACWRIVDSHEGEDNTADRGSSWECRRRNFTEVEAEEGPEVEREKCSIETRGVLEIVTEAAAVVWLRKLKSAGENIGIILDIDEDFYGCWTDMIHLHAAGIQWDNIKLLSELVSDLLCATSAEEEQVADLFYTSLINLIITLKQRTCPTGHEELVAKRGKCITQIDVSNYIIENIPSVLEFLKKMGEQRILCSTDPKVQGLFTQSILNFLQNLKIKQLHLLGELGICFEISPPSRYFEANGNFHVCQGMNRPNNSHVTFHLPTEQEVTSRTQTLRKILGSIFQKPSLVTVCRSVRDGYTPKTFFEVIESDVLSSIAFAYRSAHLEHVHYDMNLLGGKAGWPQRSQGWNELLLNHLSLQKFTDL